MREPTVRRREEFCGVIISSQITSLDPVVSDNFLIVGIVGQL